MWKHREMLWIAHALTLSRVPLAIALAFAYGDRWLVVGLVMLAATTDALDGNVARFLQRRGHTSPAIGNWLDPLVDKLFVLIALGAILVHSHDFVVVALIGAREIVLVPLVAIYLAKHHPLRDLRADWLGKLATVVQFFALAIAVASPPHARIGAAIAALVGLAAVVHYVQNGVRTRPIAE
jgi:phosphatidylglycerophosphate synthase